eukprot:gene1011-1149_t
MFQLLSSASPARVQETTTTAASTFSYDAKKLGKWRKENKINKDTGNKGMEDIYVIGGSLAPSDTLIYSVALNQWREGQTIGAPRPTLRNAVNTKDRIYVFGGNVNSASSFDCYDIVRKLWYIGRLASKAGTNISTCYDGKRYIYLVGGFTSDSFSEYLSRVDQFDTQTNKARSLGDPSYPITECTTFHHQGLIYIVGGLNNAMPVNKIVTIDPQQQPLSTNTIIDLESTEASITSKRIDKLADIPHPVDDLSFAMSVYNATNQKIYLIQDRQSFNYDIKTNQWQSLTPPPIRLECHGVVGV